MLGALRRSSPNRHLLLDAESNTWQCLPHGCQDGCYICTELDVFLENPDETMATFSKVDHIRKHMEKQLRKSACKTWTRKESRPHKLLEEKTVEEREEALKGWRNRCEIAYKAIEEVGFAKLRGILGGEWEDSMEFGLVRSAQDGKSVRRPLGGLAQGKAPSATKSSKVRTREGADVVDLTS